MFFREKLNVCAPSETKLKGVGVVVLDEQGNW